MNTFTKNQSIKARSACDSNCIWNAVVVKRTPKRVTVKVEGEREPVTVAIKLDHEGNEYCQALGSYSMAPIFRAA